MIHYCKIENGKFIFKNNNNKLFQQDLKDYEGMDIIVNIIKQPANQSINQKNYFHLLVSLLSKHIGERDQESLKDDIKQMFGFSVQKINPITKEHYSILRSSTGFTKDEYAYLISCTIDWIREFYPEFIIPDPFLFNLKKSDYERPK